MQTERCACGFTATPDDELTDHLLEMFVPPDARDATGQQHDETARLACACGFEAATTAEMDAHFFAIFTPENHMAPDGRKHVRTPG